MENPEQKTQPVILKPEQTKKNHRKGWRIFFYVLLGLLGILVLVYFLWFRPMMTKPLGEALVLAPISEPMQENLNEPSQDTTQAAAQPTPDKPTNLEDVPVFQAPTQETGAKPVCGDDAEWMLLLIGIDNKGEGYGLGLADIIRVTRVDFVNMQVNMVALQRDLMVEAPDGLFTVDDPMKINQAYLFGTTGFDRYTGEGTGANSLAQVIQYNFGVTPNHYVIVNFNAVVNFINAIGGIEVDLPTAVEDEYFGNFPAGKQWLDGAHALNLARIRWNYTDDFRIRNQSLILKGVINKLMQPATLLKVPSLINQFKDAFLTDLSLDQISTIGLCFLNNFDTANLNTYHVPPELVQGASEYIPTLSNYSFVYKWDQRLVEWIHTSLLSE